MHAGPETERYYLPDSCHARNEVNVLDDRNPVTDKTLGRSRATGGNREKIFAASCAFANAIDNLAIHAQPRDKKFLENIQISMLKLSLMVKSWLAQTWRG